MPTRQRIVRSEILDELEAEDARAIRSRRDLQRVNRIIGSCALLTRVLRGIQASRQRVGPLRLLELGAGDGRLMLRVARRLARTWPPVELTMLDRKALIVPATGIAFAQLGWTLRPLALDVLEWARAPRPHQHPPRWDVILANLFLHHFDERPLTELMSAIAARCDALVACEPERRLPALLGSYLLPALGVNGVTRHDAILSVRAGFRDCELSRLWPAAARRWRLEERRAGPFSHLFMALRGGIR